MNKLKMQSPDMIQKNIDRIAELFPSVITEKKDENGVLKKTINFEKLKQELADEVIDGEESYDFTWVGKKASIIEANTPIRKTLRPCIEESKNWETTGNLYIEGDNLDALKLLQESYLNSIKMIYIDPPYNTGKDFIYKDNFTQSKEEFEQESGTFDIDGNRLFINNESSGRFHSDWCSMLYPRLKLSHNLLREDGIIFISIDDNEVHNLRKICDEVFGESNFVANVIWHKKYAASNDIKGIAPMHDHILVYSKSQNTTINLLPRTEKQDVLYKYDSNDGKGLWRPDNLTVKTVSESYLFEIINPVTKEKYLPPKGRCWLTNSNKINEWISEGRIFFGQDGKGAPQLKRYLSEVQQGIVPLSYWSYDEVGHTDSSRKELKYIFDGNAPFDNPKPVELLKKAIIIGSNNNDIILDFFSGSSTTAHAVMQLNSDYYSTTSKVGNRKFIMIQLPEPCDEKSEAFKSGYKNICEIGKERIRRAGEKIKLDLIVNNEDKLDFSAGSAVKPESLDIGFRVLKVDSTNMKDVYYAANEYDHNQLDMFESNIKDDRTPLDLLYQCLLDWGLSLSLPHTIEKIDKVSVHTVDNGSLVACFDNNVPESVVREIAKRKPLRVVFKDSSFTDSPSKINVSEIFKTLAPGTSVKVI